MKGEIDVEIILFLIALLMALSTGGSRGRRR